MKRSAKTQGHLAILGANIIFGLNTPISRTIVPDMISPYSLTFIRMIGAALLFWTTSLFIKKEHVPIKDIVLLFFASLFAIVLNQMPFIVGLSMTSPIDASIVITILPLVSMFLAAIIIKEPITFKKAFGVFVGASGALILILSEHTGTIGEGNMTGNLIILASVLSYALYLSLFKKLVSRYSPITSMKWMFLFASIVSLPFCYRALAETPFTALTVNGYFRIGYVVVFATFLAYLLIPISQKALRPTTMTMYNYLQPIIASCVAMVLHIGTFGMKHLLSGGLVFLGVFLVTRSKSRAQVEAEQRVEN